MLIVIDLVGDDDDVVIEDNGERLSEAELEHQRRVAIEDIMRRAPQPQVVPVTV